MVVAMPLWELEMTALEVPSTSTPASWVACGRITMSMRAFCPSETNTPLVSRGEKPMRRTVTLYGPPTSRPWT